MISCEFMWIVMDLWEWRQIYEIYRNWITRSNFIWIYMNVLCGLLCTCLAVRQWVAVRAAVCGSAQGSVHEVRAMVCAVRKVVFGSARGSERLFGWVRQCAAVLQFAAARRCAAVCTAVCGSAHDSVRAVRTAMCGSALGSSVWQCTRQCAAVQQCGSVRQFAAERVSALGCVLQCAQ
jgi:hypothetical protein